MKQRMPQGALARDEQTVPGDDACASMEAGKAGKGILQGGWEASCSRQPECSACQVRTPMRKLSSTSDSTEKKA